MSRLAGGTAGCVNQEGSNLVGSDRRPGGGRKREDHDRGHAPAVRSRPAQLSRARRAGGQFNALPGAATATVTTTVNDQPGNLQFTASAYAVAENARARHHHVGADERTERAGFGQFHDGADERDRRPRLHACHADGCFPGRDGEGDDSTCRCLLILTTITTRRSGLRSDDPTGGAAARFRDHGHADDPRHRSRTATIPTVAAVQWTGTSRSITSLIISFSEPLDRGDAL